MQYYSSRRWSRNRLIDRPCHLYNNEVELEQRLAFFARVLFVRFDCYFHLIKLLFWCLFDVHTYPLIVLSSLPSLWSDDTVASF
jgi:hypothetical protein